MLYNEINSSPAKVTFKGRCKQTVLYVGIHRYDLSMLDLVTINVQSLHNLQHKNILKFIEWCQSPQHVWMVTELVDGGTLTEVLDSDGPMVPETACTFLSDIAAGLRYIHSQDIIFCDLIPSKILLDCHGVLKISDFSLCQKISAKEQRWQISDIKQSIDLMVQEFSSLKENGNNEEEDATLLARNISLESLPSPFYKSPEVLEHCDITCSSDMWSLGCILFELITGHCPFYGNMDKQLFTAVVELNLDDRRVTNNERVQDIIDGLLQVNCKNRFDWSNVSLQNTELESV